MLSGAAAAVLFALWVWRRLPRGGALTAIAVLLLYPYAFFLYGAMYSDSLFILTAHRAPSSLLERRYYWLAGWSVRWRRPAGRSASRSPSGWWCGCWRCGRRPGRQFAGPPATHRPDGIGRRADRQHHGRLPITAPNDADADRLGRAGAICSRPYRRVRWREAGVLVSGLGLAAWCIYLWVQFGDPFAFATVQEAPGWYQRGGPHTWFKVVYIGTMLFGPVDVAHPADRAGAHVPVRGVAAAAGARLFGWGYLAYCVVVLAIPIIGTKDFMGTGRYVLAAFPVIAAAGEFLATRRQRGCGRWYFRCSGWGCWSRPLAFSMGVAVS